MTQWVHGQSGNPAGRPMGSKNVQTELRAVLEAHGKEILDKLVEKAKTGETTTARFLLKRILPTARSAPIQHPLHLEGTPAEQAEQVKQRFAEGLLTMAEAHALVGLIENVELIKEVSELPDAVRRVEAKLERLESLAKKPANHAA